MNRIRHRLTIAGALVAGALSVMVISCATLNRQIVAPPQIAGAKYVGAKTCAMCHEKESKLFKITMHARVTIPGEGDRVAGQGCESCHGQGSLHVDADGKGNIINPHKKPEVCLQCHIEKNAEFSLQSHHPVKEGRMSCTNCHDPHGQDIHRAKGKFVNRLNDTCAQCHREQTRPHVFEHEAVREGCTVCHNPHGSISPKLLIQRDANLCLKCHAQVATPSAAPRSIFMADTEHTQFLSKGTCFSAGCHTAIHGSNLNPMFRY